MKKLRVTYGIDEEQIDIPIKRMVEVYDTERADLLSVRLNGAFRSRGFWLNDEYDWVLGLDDKDCPVLIPLRKED